MPRRRYELTDEQFERIEPVLPEVDGRGCPYKDHRRVLNGIFWILRSGAPWRDLPERYGNWKTVYDRFRRWPATGAYDADWIRQWCRKRGIESVIPARPRKGPGRPPPTCDDQKYERRNTIERLVGRLKERRRLVVRYEKKASHYKAMLLWAFVREYLKR